jgi:hypothetical protein
MTVSEKKKFIPLKPGGKILLEEKSNMFTQLYKLWTTIKSFFSSLAELTSKKKVNAKSYIENPNYYSMNHSKGFYMYYYTNKARVQRIKNKVSLKGFA